MLKTDWSFKTNEALDMILLLNAVSNDPFYNQHYSDVREKWMEKLGERGLSLIARIRSVISMSKLCSELYRINIMTLDEVISFFEDATNLRKSSLQILLPYREVFHECFKMLKDLGLDETWESRAKPYLEGLAKQYGYVMNKSYPLDDIRREINKFLGASQPICSIVYLATYIKPIAFQLPGGGMAIHPGPHGYMHLPKQLACLCIHESLHGFPDSANAQQCQDELRKKNNEFEKQYQELVTNYNSSPEEYFVVGADAYLSLKLNIRTHEECVEYLKTQNGGMSLSLAIYEELRNTNPDQEDNWTGYGKWLHNQLLTINHVSSRR
ncbi:hypothetical protein [Paenibacillus sp. ATY16]|uniref:hypothetical protein n=1 Tax=Paenibacillus sp. ATY16 TaxID=1759312 RepID=UPI000E2F2A84|nr:hypothetical protein [Paenibacillus sp. ATY16]MCK9861796.1 hypothetical protein [Paenibacillus sp. ATY16]